MVAAKHIMLKLHYWALRVGELLLPSPHHRCPNMASVGEWHLSTLGESANEERAAYTTLGVIGSAGVLAALVWSFRGRSTSPRHQLAFGLLIVATLLIASPGALGPLFNAWVTPWIRCYHRLGVYVGFLALATVVKLFDYVFQPSAGWWRRLAAWVSAAVLIAIGLYDQTPVPNYTPADVRAAAFHADRDFVGRVEAMLPNGAAVFQLPYVPYPECGPTCEMADYSHTRGYLHSTHLRWSYGATKGRPAAEWQRSVSALPAAEFVTAIADRGFDAVWVDRWGYPNRVAEVETGLSAFADGPPLVSPDGRYAVYSLARFRSTRGEGK